MREKTKRFCIAYSVITMALALTTSPAIAATEDSTATDCQHEWEVTYSLDRTNTTDFGWAIVATRYCLTHSTVEATCIGTMKSTVTTAATCTTDGSMTISVESFPEEWAKPTDVETGIMEIKAFGHSYKKVTVKAKKCKSGYVGKKCTACGKIIKTKILKAKKTHKWKYVKVPATCTVSGYTAMKCKACGKLKDKSIIGAPGHRWQVLSEKIKVTCEEAGMTAHKRCKRCGIEKGGEIIPALGHEWSNSAGEVFVFDETKPLVGQMPACKKTFYCDHDGCFRNKYGIVGYTSRWERTW